MIEIHSIINSIFNSVTYIIYSDNSRDTFIVDCGDLEPIIDFIQRKELNLRGILLTHTHFDHIYGLNEVVDVFPDCEVYTSENGRVSLYDPKLNFSRYHTNSTPFIYKYQNVVILEDGDIIKFSNEEIKAIATPGHDWSCMTYIAGDNIFSGDSYFPGIKVMVHFPKSDKELAEISLERILKEAVGKNVYTGHILIE